MIFGGLDPEGERDGLIRMGDAEGGQHGGAVAIGKDAIARFPGCELVAASFGGLLGVDLVFQLIACGFIEEEARGEIGVRESFFR